jgi:hypothetical protein
VWGVGSEDLFGDGHGGLYLGPAGVEGEVGERFDELCFGGAVGFGEVEVRTEVAMAS